MIILIAGASHVGKTILAQRMLEKNNYPYFSIDHLKMGLIRSGNTDLTPEDDDALTDYLWPIVREIIKTAIENDQNLIVEGCYIPFDWRDSFDEQYLQSIRFICLAMSDEYIDANFGEIKAHGSDIEKRLDDSYCTVEQLKKDNHQIIAGYQSNGEQITLITESYDDSIKRSFGVTNSDLFTGEFSLGLEDLLFYEEYERFYLMTRNSSAFRHFCKKAFGADFSQDGFSDISQIDRILSYIPRDREVHILDIGCGNGKVLAYIQEKTGANIHGFDYSSRAIETAKELFKNKADFRQGVIGEIEYQPEMFDIIISLDTMYFASDMSKFVGQVMKWLKKNGVFMAFYQEGDVMPKTENENTSVLAKALLEKNIAFDCINITRESYDLLLRKKEAAIFFKEEFEEEGNGNWFEMLAAQTENADKSFEDYAKEMARYIYVVKK